MVSRTQIQSVKTPQEARNFSEVPSKLPAGRQMQGPLLLGSQINSVKSFTSGSPLRRAPKYTKQVRMWTFVVYLALLNDTSTRWSFPIYTALNDSQSLVQLPNNVDDTVRMIGPGAAWSFFRHGVLSFLDHRSRHGPSRPSRNHC